MLTIIGDPLQVKQVEAILRKILLQLPDHRLGLIPLLRAYRCQRLVPAIASSLCIKQSAATSAAAATKVTSACMN